MEKKRTFEDAKRFISPEVPRRPKTLSLAELARRTASIRKNNVTRHKAHVERLALMEGIKKAQLHHNMRIERDALLGASLHAKGLREEAHNHMLELTRILDGEEAYNRMRGERARNP